MRSYRGRVNRCFGSVEVLEAVTGVAMRRKAGLMAFRGERFPGGESGRDADSPTCYPGQAHRGATAHYGVSETVKRPENERAQPINRQKSAKNLHGSRAVFRKEF